MPNRKVPDRAKAGNSKSFVKALDAAFDAAVDRCVEELTSESDRCLVFTWKAIDAAQPANKLKALESGLNEWKRELSVAATRQYETSFKLWNSGIHSENPLDIAYEETATGLSFFLRVSALNGCEEGPTGRVREFIWRAVTGNPEDPAHSDYQPLIIQLPAWVARRTLGVLIAGSGELPPTQGILSVDQTDRIVRTAERKLLEGLRDALRRARRDAVIEAGTNASEAKVVPPPVRINGSSQRASAKNPRQSSNARASKKRAKQVAKTLDELLVLKAEPQFELPEDFDSAQARFRRRQFYVFDAAAKFPAIRNLLLTVKNTKRKPLRLAQEIVSIAECCSIHTIAMDWKNHKPRDLRRR